MGNVGVKIGGRDRHHPSPPRGPRWSLGWVLGVILLAGCSGPIRSDPRPRVVASSTILYDLAARVGGPDIQLSGLMAPGDDPHIYEPVPRDTVAIERSDLVLLNGYNLEPQVIKLAQSNARGRVAAVGERIVPLQLHQHGATVPDPHVWGSARNGVILVEAIRDELSRLRPGNRPRFTARATAEINRLRRLDAWIVRQIATIPPDRRHLVTTHDAFQYFAQAYGLEVAGTLIGISTEEQPSAQTVRALANQIRRLRVPTVFAETTTNSALLETVAQEAEVKLSERALFADAIGGPGSGADSYATMLVANTRAIVLGLGGRLEPFTP